MRKNVNNMHEMAIEPFHNMKTKKKGIWMQNLYLV